MSTKIVSDGNATDWVQVDVSSYVPIITTNISIKVTNKSDMPIDFHIMDIDNLDQVINILEGRTTDISVNLDLNHGFLYYVDSGTVDIYLITYSSTAGTIVEAPQTYYCTPNQVANFMGLPIFTVSTTPTNTIVQDIVDSVCDEIDQFTHHAWRTTRVTDEHYSSPEWTPMVDGLGDWSDRSRLYMMHRKIRNPMIKLEAFDGSTWVDFVTSYTEGRANDYWIDYDRGIIHFANRYPLRRRHAVRLTYDYGDSTVPADIKNAAVMLCAYQLLQSDDRSVLLPEGTSNISPQNKSENWYNRAYRLLARHVDLISYQ